MSSSDAPGVITVDGAGPSRWIVALHGEHDMTNRDRLHEKLAPLLTQATFVVVDLSPATFIDSSIVKELIAGHEQVDDVPAQQLAIVAPKDGFARRVLDLMQADGVLRIFEDHDAAFASLRPANPREAAAHD
jgi:anti-anti-sigma factor